MMKNKSNDTVDKMNEVLKNNEKKVKGPSVGKLQDMIGLPCVQLSTIQNSYSIERFLCPFDVNEAGVYCLRYDVSPISREHAITIELICNGNKQLDEKWVSYQETMENAIEISKKWGLVSASMK